MNILTHLATSVGLGASAGINAYATFLVFGILARFYPARFTGDLADFFSSTPVLCGMAVLYAIEFFADKIPAIDHAWDVIHTFVRPLAGVVISFAAVDPALPKSVSIVAAIISGGAALGTHLTKSTVRATSTATTGGVANPILSLIEDLIVFVQTAIVVVWPYLFLALFVVILLPTIFVARSILSRRRAIP